MGLDLARERMKPRRTYGTFGNALKPQHQPRPWRCTSPEAIYCPLHGDCTCGGDPPQMACPLHGVATEHARAEDES